MSDSEAFATARKLARLEGIIAGMSTGAALYGAMKIAERIDSGRIVVILPDRGEKYLSTTLFSD